jgi:hypothetical protein
MVFQAASSSTAQPTVLTELALSQKHTARRGDWAAPIATLISRACLWIRQAQHTAQEGWRECFTCYAALWLGCQTKRPR